MDIKDVLLQYGLGMKSLTLLGIIASMIGYPFIFLTIAYSPWFNIFDNALSDLGNSELNPSISWLFNIGLILNGFLVIIFGFLISYRSFFLMHSLWKISLMLSGISLGLIGFFPEEMGDIHLFVSISFFASIIITFFIYGVSSYLRDSHNIGVLVVLMGLVTTFVWVYNWPWKGFAIQETVNSLIGSVWLILISFKNT
jgi:hypothetical membrane protein